MGPVRVAAILLLRRRSPRDTWRSIASRRAEPVGHSQGMLRTAVSCLPGPGFEYTADHGLRGISQRFGKSAVLPATCKRGIFYPGCESVNWLDREMRVPPFPAVGAPDRPPTVSGPWGDSRSASPRATNHQQRLCGRCCACGRRGCSDPQASCALRHADGVTPSSRRNHLVRWDWSARPHSRAIWHSGSSVRTISCFARSIRRRTR